MRCTSVLHRSYKLNEGPQYVSEPPGTLEIIEYVCPLLCKGFEGHRQNLLESPTLPGPEQVVLIYAASLGEDG